jgi:hypothetical protein
MVKKTPTQYPVMLRDRSLTVDISFHCGGNPARRARFFNLTEHQTNLAYSMDCVNGRIGDEPTGATVEHKLKETSEKSGETAMPGKTQEMVVSYLTFVKGFLKVLSKAWQGDHKK